jgi:hypothetical protein
MFVIDTGVAELRNYDIGETLRCKVIVPVYATPRMPTVAPTTLLTYTHSTPAPVTSELAFLAPHLSFLRRTLEIVSWRSASHWESWLVLGAWWAVSLGGYPAFR